MTFVQAAQNSNVPWGAYAGWGVAAIALLGTLATVWRTGRSDQVKSIDQRISEAFDAKDNQIASLMAENKEMRDEVRELRKEVAGMAQEITLLRSEVTRLSSVEAAHAQLRVEHQAVLDQVQFLQSFITTNGLAIPAWEPRRAAKQIDPRSSLGRRP